MSPVDGAVRESGATTGGRQIFDVLDAFKSLDIVLASYRRNRMTPWCFRKERQHFGRQGARKALPRTQHVLGSSAWIDRQIPGIVWKRACHHIEITLNFRAACQVIVVKGQREGAVLPPYTELHEPYTTRMPALLYSPYADKVLPIPCRCGECSQVAQTQMLRNSIMIRLFGWNTVYSFHETIGYLYLRDICCQPENLWSQPQPRRNRNAHKSSSRFCDNFHDRFSMAKDCRKRFSRCYAMPALHMLCRLYPF